MFKTLILIILTITLQIGNVFSEDTTIDPKGNTLLEKIDKNLTPISFESYRKLINIEPNGKKKEFVLYTAKKGNDKMVTTFLSPKTELGRSTLRIDDNMWLYIPNVGKPVRITSMQSVTGGIFNNSDIMRLDYSSEYNCIKLDNNIMTLKAKTSSVAYDKLLMTVDIKIMFQQKSNVIQRLTCLSKLSISKKQKRWKRVL